MSRSLITGPSSEPLSLADAKTHLRVDDDTEDTLISSLIAAARQHVELVTGRVFGQQSWRWQGSFSDAIELLPDLVSVTTVDYLDTAGASQSADAGLYYVDTAALVGRVVRLGNQSWPATDSNHPRPVTIDFTAGKAAPEPVTQAMRLLIGHWFEHREAVIVGTISSAVPLAVDYLLAPYRIARIG